MTRSAAANDTLMWEAKAARCRLSELVEWISTEALPALRRQRGCRGVEVYASTEERAVVIAHFDDEPANLPDPPPELLERPPHQWPFQHVGD